jgi:hypothetical protein
VKTEFSTAWPTFLTNVMMIGGSFREFKTKFSLKTTFSDVVPNKLFMMIDPDKTTAL